MKIPKRDSWIQDNQGNYYRVKDVFKLKNGRTKLLVDEYFFTSEQSIIDLESVDSVLNEKEVPDAFEPSAEVSSS